jgi:hypothetical protein
MATKAEVNAVYAAGLIQGITLVTFPALSTIFTHHESRIRHRGISIAEPRVSW